MIRASWNSAPEMMNIVIANRQRVKSIDARLLKRVVSAILTKLDIRHCELEINLVGAREMAVLNETFLKHEGSTDVITFDYCEGKRLRSEVEISGEIFISVDDAIVHSKKFKAKWQSEVVRYIAHGILHLLGHDDLSPQPRRRMKREENRLVTELSRCFALSKL
jgi:probable rRNA maturation factor